LTGKVIVEKFPPYLSFFAIAKILTIAVIWKVSYNYSEYSITRRTSYFFY
jgi:hypothetical protein